MVRIIGNNKDIYPTMKTAEEIADEIFSMANNSYDEAFDIWTAELNRGELTYALKQAFLCLIQNKGMKQAFVDIIRSVQKM